jgi:hypothetical protein
MIVDAPWYVPNMVIRRDPQIPTVKEEIHGFSSQYSARLSAHPNHLIVNLTTCPALLSDLSAVTRHIISFAHRIQLQDIGIREATEAEWGHAVAQWLRNYATSRKVVGLRPHEVNE